MSRTPQTQQHILEVLTRHHTLTAPAILSELQRVGQEVNKTTMYRALEKMVTQGKLCCHFFGGTTVHYELANHHHGHLVCECCGRIESVEGTVQLPPNLAGFTPEHEHLTVFGHCRQCPHTPHTHAQT